MDRDIQETDWWNTELIVCVMDSTVASVLIFVVTVVVVLLVVVVVVVVVVLVLRVPFVTALILRLSDVLLLSMRLVVYRFLVTVSISLVVSLSVSRWFLAVLLVRDPSVCMCIRHSEFFMRDI